MAKRNPLFASPTYAEKHPFQIDGLMGVLGSCQMSPMGFVGFFVRLDMPGVPRNGFRFSKDPRNFMVTFNATAPKKESFPFDESDRVYAGFLNVNRNPLVIPVQVIAQNGSFLMLFRATEGGLYLMPLPRSASAQIAPGPGKSNKGEGTSSGNSIEEAEVILDKINLDAMNLEGSGKYGSPIISSNEPTKGSAKTKQVDSSGESIDKADEKSEQQEISPNPIDKAEGSAKFEQGEGRSGKPIGKAEGSGEARSSSSSNQDDEAWIFACIKRNILQIQSPIQRPERPKEESATVDTSPTEQSSHGVPEVAIGSIKECVIHRRQCQCQRCDSDGVCLKTWSTTEDTLRYINRLKIKGPDGVCEKRVVQEDGRYSLYVRADLPGLDPHLCVTTVRDRCILVYGKPQPHQYYAQFRAARNYLFFVQLRCSCCKFDNLRQEHEDGVLSLFCKIIGPEPASSAD